MHDAKARWHNAESVEGLHAPLHELVTLVVTRELELHVEVERLLRGEVVDHHRVVDDKINRGQRVDFLRIAAKADDTVAHRGKIDNRRNTGEILHQNARGAVGADAHDAGVSGRAQVGQRAGALGSDGGGDGGHVAFSGRVRVAEQIGGRLGARGSAGSPS